MIHTAVAPSVADVGDATRDAAQVAAAVFRAVRGIVFAGTLVVVPGIAIVETVDHQEVDDLVAPVRGCDGVGIGSPVARPRRRQASERHDKRHEGRMWGQNRIDRSPRRIDR